MFQQLLKQFLQKFVKNMGRQPQTPGEWMEIQNQAVRYLNKTKGAPPIKKEPFQGFNPKVIEGGKGQNAPEVSGIDSLLKSDFEKAVKPKKDRMNIRLMKNWEKELTDIDLAQEGYNLQEIGILQKARNVMKKEGQNPDDALQWVKSEMADAEGVDIEDFMPDFDWGDFPGKRDFAEGGIAPLVGEPTYAADFYDDRTPMEEGGMTQEDFNQFLKEREEGYHEGGKHELEKDWKRYKRFKKYGKGAVQEAAEGGRMGYAGGALVKGGRWFLNNLRKALKDIENNKGFKNLTPERKEGLTSEIKNLIKSVEGGGPLPDDMVQTIRHDPKFAEISRTRSTDPDLYEFEDVILNYGKKGDVVDEQVKVLEQMDVTNRRPNFLGGRIGYSGGGSAGLPAVTMGSPHSPPMKQPQMPGGPQPTGIPGGTIVAPNNTQQNPWMGQNPNMNQGIGGMPRPQPGGMPRTMAAEGGSMRMPFGLGGINKGRRAFMKWIAGLTGAGIAAGSGLLKLGKAAKVAKVAPKVAETIVSSNAAGMPAWFPSLVKRVLKEGEDITGKAGSEAMERQTVHTIKLPDSGTPIEVTRDLVTDDIIVDIGLSKHGFASGKFGQPVRLELKKGEWIEPNTTGGGFTTKGGDNVYPGMSKGFSETAETSGKNMKSKDEFWVEEAEFSGGHPENVKFEDSSVNQFGKHESDFSEVEAFATGKSKKGARKASESFDKQGEDLADHFSNYPEPDDFAKGGIAHLLGE